MVRLLSWVEGRLWSQVNPINQSLLKSLGEQAGALSSALQGFKHPMASRTFDWDLAQAAWTSRFLYLFSEEEQQILQYFQTPYQAFQDEYSQLRKSVVQNDANDNNVIVSENLLDPEVNAIIDFGDAVHTQLINDLAISIAYAVMGKPDALSAALPLVKGYHEKFPIMEKELEFLYVLAANRKANRM